MKLLELYDPKKETPIWHEFKYCCLITFDNDKSWSILNLHKSCVYFYRQQVTTVFVFKINNEIINNEILDFKEWTQKGFLVVIKGDVLNYIMLPDANKIKNE